MPKKALKNIIINYFSDHVIESIEKGSSIYKEDTIVDGVYLLMSGTLKISKKREGLDSFVLWYADEGDLVGLYSYFNNQNHYFNVTATENSTFIYISRKEFEELLNKDDVIKMQILTILCRRITYIEKRIAKMQKKTPSRLADAIIFYAKKAEENSNSNTFEYNAEELASIVGTTQSYLQKLLKDFANKNLILKGRKELQAKDISALERLANAS